MFFHHGISFQCANCFVFQKLVLLYKPRVSISFKAGGKSSGIDGKVVGTCRYFSFYLHGLSSLAIKKGSKFISNRCQSSPAVTSYWNPYKPATKQCIKKLKSNSRHIHQDLQYFINGTQFLFCFKVM